MQENNKKHLSIVSLCQDFCLLLSEKTKEMDTETHFKDTFRVFSKDEEGLLI